MLVFKPWKTGNIWGNADWDGRVRIDNDVILDPGVKDTDGTLWCEFRIEVQKSVIWTSEESSGLYTGVNILQFECDSHNFEIEFYCCRKKCSREKQKPKCHRRRTRNRKQNSNHILNFLKFYRLNEVVKVFFLYEIICCFFYGIHLEAFITLICDLLWPIFSECLIVLTIY